MDPRPDEVSGGLPVRHGHCGDRRGTGRSVAGARPSAARRMASADRAAVSWTKCPRSAAPSAELRFRPAAGGQPWPRVRWRRILPSWQRPCPPGGRIFPASEAGLVDFQPGPTTGCARGRPCWRAACGLEQPSDAVRASYRAVSGAAGQILPRWASGSPSDTHRGPEPDGQLPAACRHLVQDRPGLHRGLPAAPAHSKVCAFLRIAPIPLHEPHAGQTKIRPDPARAFRSASGGAGV